MDEEVNNEKEMDDKEAGQKAKIAQEMHHNLAEQYASAFETWLNEHKDATKEEAHERLVKTIEMSIMFSMMSLMML